MQVRITPLRFWKSEHTNIEKCEDALAYKPEHGLFVVADGAGTAAYANIWSQLLVERYITCPLLSNDPFEVEWWLDEPQRQFVNDPHIPKAIDKRNWQEQKTRDLGSQSTLATVRVRAITSDAAKADLLVFGDSCVMRGRSGKVDPFPLKTEAEFDANPICLPSLRKLYSRKFHQAEVRELDLQPGDTLLLATDAVSKWIIGCGDKHGTIWEAFRAVTTIRDDIRWQEAVLGWRTGPRAMRDDDSTALIIEICADSADGSQPLGATDGSNDLKEHYAKCLDARREEFERAKDNNDHKQMAIVYGDGQMLQAAGMTLVNEQRSAAREVADAWKEVFDATLRKLDFESNKAGASDIDLESIWWDNRDKLRHEPSASGLIETLSGLGIQIDERPATNAPNRSSATRPVNSAWSKPADVLPHASMPSESAQAAAIQTSQQRSQEQVRKLQKALIDKDYFWIDELVQQSPEILSDRNFSKLDQIDIAKAQSYVMFMNAIEENNDSRIANKYDPTIADLITPANQRRYDLAIQNLETLARLRQALKDNNDQLIVAVYDSEAFIIQRIRNILTEEDQQRIELARRRIEMRKAVYAAIDAENDQELTRAFKSELNWPGAFGEEEYKRIERAQQRMDQQLKVQQMLHDNNEPAIAREFDLLIELFKDRDAKGNVAELFSSEEAQRLESAKARDAAYKQLLSAIAANKDEQIIAAYVPVLHDYLAVTDGDRARVIWAKRLIAFVEASEKSQVGDDEDVTSTFDSSFEKYTPGEPMLATRLHRARARLRDARGRGEFITNLRVALDKADYVFIVQHTGQILDLFERNDPGLRINDPSKLSKVYNQLGAMTRFWNGVITNNPEEIVNGYVSAQNLGMSFTTLNDHRYVEAVEKVASKRRKR
jgi:hypothetical protein